MEKIKIITNDIVLIIGRVKAVLLTLFLCSICNLAYTQTVIAIVNGIEEVTDFKCLEKLNSSDNVQFKFSGMNPLMYEYQISVHDTFNSIGEAPALFSLLSIDKLTEFISGINNVTSAIIETTSKKNKETTVENFDVERCIDKSKPLIENYFPEIVDQLVDSIDQNIKLDSLVCKYHNLLHEQNQIIQGLRANSNNAEKAILDINVAMKSWKYDESLSFDFDYKSFKSNLVESKTNNLNLLENISDLIEQNKKHNKIFGPFEKRLLSLNKTTKAKLNHLDTLISFEKYANQLAAYKNYVGYASFMTMPIKVGPNGKDVTLKIAPYGDKVPAPSYEMDVSIRPKYMMSFGFSSGFYVSGLHDEVFSNIEIDSTFSPVEEINSSFEIGINALAHLKIGSGNLKFQLGLGPTLAIKKTLMPGISGGIGVALGGKYNLVITIGGNIGYVKRESNILTNQISFNDNQPDYTVDVLKRSWFISVGYNFINF